MGSRRDFIKQSIFASGALMTPNFLGAINWLNPDEISGYKNVIIIQLSGGNDGLNTVVPFNNDIYYKLRPTLGIKKDKVLKLNDELGLHYKMTALKELYDQGELSVINGVGYPNPNRSHFRSMDIWHTGSNSNQYLSTGWLGRYLDANGEHPHEVLEVNNSMSLALKGVTGSGMAVDNPKTLYDTTRDPFFKDVLDAHNSTMLSDDNLGYLYKTMQDTFSSADYIYNTSKIYKSKMEYPSNQFAKKLKQISGLIISGLKTRVYYVSLGGFDTHVWQGATQERLLEMYSEGVGALVKDLKKNKRFDDTLIFTFSEFGRRVEQNASQGTDHGTANNVFVIGGKLKKKGVYNAMPSLLDLDQGDLKYSIDFREIYATILGKWLDVKSEKVLLKNYSTLSFI